MLNDRIDKQRGNVHAVADAAEARPRPAAGDAQLASLEPGPVVGRQGRRLRNHPHDEEDFPGAQ